MPSDQDWEQYRKELEEARSMPKENAEREMLPGEEREEEKKSPAGQVHEKINEKVGEKVEEAKEKIKEKAKEKVKNSETYQKLQEKLEKNKLYKKYKQAVDVKERAKQEIEKRSLASVRRVIIRAIMLVLNAIGDFLGGLFLSILPWLFLGLIIIIIIIVLFAGAFGILSKFSQDIQNFLEKINPAYNQSAQLSATIPPEWSTVLQEAGKAVGVPPALIAAAYLTEKHWTVFKQGDINPSSNEPGCDPSYSFNSKNAVGPFQVIPNLWQEQLNAQASSWGFSSPIDLCNYTQAAYAAAYILKSDMAEYNNGDIPGTNTPNCAYGTITATYSSILSSNDAHKVGCRYCGTDNMNDPNCNIRSKNWNYGDHFASNYLALIASMINGNIVRLALSQLGVMDDPPSSYCNKYSKQGHYSNCFGGPYKFSEPWCADFVVWLYQSLGEKITPSASAKALWDSLPHTVSAPTPGTIYYGTGTSWFPNGHVGVVVGVTKGNNGVTITTVNGDWGAHEGRIGVIKQTFSNYSSSKTYGIQGFKY